MAELSDISFPYPESVAKNLFVCDDRKYNYYLITLKGDKRVDLKAFRHKYGTRPLSLAKEDDLKKILGLMPGSVTPLGILNDREHKTHFFLDEDFLRALATMPPSGGAALGVDRLCMVLLDQAEIDGVRAFLPPVGGLW